MSESKFTPQEIELFGDKIENCLNHPACILILENYLKKTRKSQLLRVLRLWKRVEGSTMCEDEQIQDLIDNIDGFNENPLLTLSEAGSKFAYIKTECCRLLKRHDTHTKFIKYLCDYHKRFLQSTRDKFTIRLKNPTSNSKISVKFQNIESLKIAMPPIVASSRMDYVYQVRITLLETEPEIWRRVEIMGVCTFQDFHKIIQRAMGWKNCHNYKFDVKNPTTGCIETVANTPDCLESFGKDCSNDLEVRLVDYMKAVGDKCFYLYDFGAKWEHIVELEACSPPIVGMRYPRCLEGARACPPENCGGPEGYLKMLEVVKNPRHRDYVNVMEWLKNFTRGFDPDKFHPTAAFK